MKIERFKKNFSKGVIYFFIIVPAIIWLLPLVSTVFLSFKTEKEIMVEGAWAFPKTLNFETIKTTFLRLSPYIKNSIIITVPAAFFSVLISAFGAYVLARKSFKGKNIILFYFLSGLMIPSAVCLVPLFKLMQGWGLYNTYMAQILTNISFGIPICTFVLRNFFITIPKSIEEAAIIDGCSDFMVFRKIILPISAATVATMVGFQFIWIWNTLVWGLVLAINEKVQPIMVGIVNLKGSYEMAWNVSCAAALISMILPMIIFFSLQKYLAKGLFAGAGIKG